MQKRDSSELVPPGGFEPPLASEQFDRGNAKRFENRTQGTQTSLLIPGVFAARRNRGDRNNAPGGLLRRLGDRLWSLRHPRDARAIRRRLRDWTAR